MDKQKEMEYMLRNLQTYNLKKKRKKKNSKKEVFKNAQIFFQGRNLIIKAFENGIFPLPNEEPYKHEEWK